MRSYGHYCGLARALDVVGERWALLIVRELLDGPRRYTELLDGLPGIATNLLAERLRGLEDSGVISRLDDGRYRLTEWGEGLRDPVYALGRWAAPAMARPQGDDAFRSHWMRHMVVVRFEGVDPRRKDLVVEVRCVDQEPVTLVSSGGRVQMVRGPASAPDLTLTGPPDAVVGLLTGRISGAKAMALGVGCLGEIGRLRGLRPSGETRTVRERHLTAG